VVALYVISAIYNSLDRYLDYTGETNCISRQKTVFFYFLFVQCLAKLTVHITGLVNECKNAWSYQIIRYLFHFNLCREL